jgi:hypothetical protein
MLCGQPFGWGCNLAASGGWERSLVLSLVVELNDTVALKI